MDAAPRLNPIHPEEIEQLSDYAAYKDMAESLPQPHRPYRLAVLDDAAQYIGRDRNSNYGNPEQNFETIANLWDTYLSRRFGVHIPIAAYDVAVMSALIKAARLANYPFHQDSFVDMAGYAACGAEVAYLSDDPVPTRIPLQDMVRYIQQEQAELAEIMGELS